MRYLALATDYDGTLSSDDKVSELVIRALQRLKVSGRRAILVTGRRLDDLLAVGHSPERTLEKFARAAGRTLAWPTDLSYQAGRGVAWFSERGLPPFAMQAQPGRAERIRHHRKYAEGNLRWHSFYFRGPDNRHNLKAQNLVVFCQIAQGIDESTWMYHLNRGDYSRWFREAIKDSHFADETERIENRTDLAPWQTRQIVQELIGARYTLPE